MLFHEKLSRKCLECIPSVELGTVNMRSKEMSVRVKEAIIKLKKPSSMAKSATWSQPNRACFSVTEDKIERPTKKQKMKEAVVKTQ